MRICSDDHLDAILALQFTLAWAGETGEPRRLGWWGSDVIDPNTGGDLFARLAPRTGVWASYCVARETAMRVDAQQRAQLADGDEVFTAFSLGFAMDEALDDRIAELKRSGADTSKLPWPVPLEHFDLASLRAAIPAAPAFTVVAGGRQLKTPMPSQPHSAMQQLAAVLLATPTATDLYPLAFFRGRA